MGQTQKYSRPQVLRAIARQEAGETWAQVADALGVSEESLKWAIYRFRNGAEFSEVSATEERQALEKRILEGATTEELMEHYGWSRSQANQRCYRLGYGFDERHDIRAELGLEAPRPKKPAPEPRKPRDVRIRERAEIEAMRTAYPLERRSLRRAPTRCVAA